MKKFRATGVVLAFCGLAHAAWAGWAAGDLDQLTSEFTAGISAAYSSTPYPWQFLSCDAATPNCFGTNPDSPYGAPNFGPSASSDSSSTTQLKPTDALVLIMETPPPMRYFGLTPYIFTRYYPNALPANPATPGFVPVFESLGDTVNLADMGTAGSATPGGNPFTQLSVTVVTADQVTYDNIAAQFAAIGFPATAINQVALPINAVPLNMGQGPTRDTYSVLLRMAYPNDPAQMADYISRAPLRVLSLSPIRPRSVAALPTPVSRTPGSSPAEPSKLALARDMLVNQLEAQFGAAYTITENTVQQKQTHNYVCVAHGLPCNGDNPDAIYSSDAQGFVPNSPDDRILIVGVNHVSQGKATYLSHSVVAAANNMGVEGVSDAWLTGTGLTMGGVSGPSDPRYATYSQLYAFTLSYHCAGDPVCITIPQATAGQPIGIPYGSPINITGRVYLDPQTKTRPSTSDIIPHRVFILRKISAASAAAQP